MDNKENIENISPKLTTKVYYFVDDQTTPYSTELPIRPSEITLNDFKKHITRRNYKYYCKVMDPALNAEVKAEIRDPNELLKPNSDGRFELFLLTENTQPQQSEVYQPLIKSALAPPPHLFQNNRLFADSNFASSLSDGDSQYTTTDFTSVSQQKPYGHGGDHYKSVSHNIGNQNHNRNAGHHQMIVGNSSNNKRYDQNNKPCWTREKRKRYRRSPPPSSFLSTTFEDTEISMALDLITVTFNMDSRRPFGMSVIVKETRTFSGILVHQITPGGLVALDGRIKPGYILLEVNEIPLDDCETTNLAIDLLTSSVRHAIETRGQLKLTCAKGEEQRQMRNVFAPPRSEPVRPIDPMAWIQHVHLMNAGGVMPIDASDCIHKHKEKENTQKQHAIKPIDAPDHAHGENTQMDSVAAADEVMRIDASDRLNEPHTQKQQQQKGQAIKKTHGHGGIGSTLRRLVCIPTIKRHGSRKRKAGERDAKDNNK